MGFEDEVTAMNAFSEPPGTETPGTIAPGTTAPGTDAPSTNAPATSAPATDAPTTDAPVESELDRYKRENEELRRQIEDAKKKPATQTPSTTAPSTDAPPEPRVFIKDEEELEDISRDPTKFNELLNQVYQAGVKSAKAGQKKVNHAEIVNQTAQIVAEMTEARRIFYENNKDLVGMKADVAVAFGDIAKANPTFTIQQVLDATAKEVRRRKSVAESEAKDDGKNEKGKKPPNLPPGTKGKRSQGKPSTQQSKLESEIAAMNEMED